MSWRTRLVVGFLVLMVLPQIIANLPGGSNAPSEVAPPPLPLPADRVRRPLPAASPDDPLYTIEDKPIGANQVSFGTSFPIGAGTWLTARHVANESCGRLVMLVDNRRLAATIAYLHPQADLALLTTAMAGGPALALEDAPLSESDTGYSFGFPGGQLGATEDELMGRSRMQLAGALEGTGPILTWAEVKRFPDDLPALGGMSGGPMVAADGKVVGIMVAASARRGRVESVAPEVLEAAAQRVAPDSTAHAAPASEVAGQDVALGDAVEAFNRNDQIAKTYCLPAGVADAQVPGLAGRR